MKPNYPSREPERSLTPAIALAWSLLLGMRVVSTAAATPAAAGQRPAEPRVSVMLDIDSSEVLTARFLEPRREIGWHQLRDQGPQWVNGIRIAAGHEKSAIIFHSLEREIVVQAHGFAGWAAKVPRGDQGCFRVEGRRGLLDLGTPRENSQPVTVRFGDGGRAEINAGSNTRLDRLDDGTYVFSGNGDIYAIDNAGSGMSLTADRPPLTGGPVAEATGPNGATRQTRLSPVTMVTVSGEPGSRLTLGVGGQVATLLPGGLKTFRFPNGSVLRARQNPTTRTLDWRVDKGYFRFEIEGMNCWHPQGLADQAASLQWNAKTKMGDLQNRSAGQEELVDLAIRYFAAVGPRATLQYQQLDDCTTFSVSATGGQAALFDAESGQEYAVGLNSFLVKAGMPEAEAAGTTPLGGKPRKVIVLSPVNGSALQVQGALGGAAIEPNSQKTLRGPGSSQVQFNYDTAGRLTAQAVVGNYTMVLPTSAGDIALGLDQGDAVWLSGQPEGKWLTVQTPSANLSPVLLEVGGEGWSLGPKARVTINTSVGDNGFLMADLSGAVNQVFGTSLNEIAGAIPPSASAPPPMAASPLPTAPNTIDGSRIQQLPVSPFSP